ncbi:MAG: hypothetical protein SNJ77_11790 [Cytophagales bacterium]
MTETEKSWHALKESLERLYHEFHECQKKLDAANEDNLKLKLLIKEKDERIKNLETQEKIVKIADNLAEDTQKTTDLKLKINEYIREIDRCIAFLSND